ncbi:TrbI/VirB10 family protein [Burkholderia multivorans]|nr:TrbI/VirB10 family protein [Burkholderia multivorans]
MTDMEREPDDLPSERSPEEDIAEQRKRGLASLRRESLAAKRKSENSARLFVTVGSLVFVGMAGIFILKHRHSTPEPTPQQTAAAKIDETPPPVTPLDDKQKPDGPASAVAASAVVVKDTQPDDEAEAERRRRAIAAAEAELAREKAEKARQIRLKSDIFDSESSSGGDGSDSSRDAGESNAARTGDRSVNDPNASFARSVNSEGLAVTKVQKFDRTECKVMPGQIIEASLRPRVTSDLPDSVSFLVTRDVYGHRGRKRLIPWGTVITGRTNPVVRPGQERTFMPTANAVLPDGAVIQLGSSVSDQLGTAGIDGDVNRHVGQIIGMSAVLAILGAGAATAGVSSDSGNNSASLYRQSVQQSFAQSSQQLLGGYANIPPTITNKQGTRVRIQVEQVLDFSDHCGSREPGSVADADE